MKQNSKIYLCALLLVGAVSMMTAGAQGSGKPTLAVFVVGNMDNTLVTPLTTALGTNLTSGGRYTLTSVNTSNKLAELQAAYNAGGGGSSIDRNALAEWGRKAGISAICLVVDDVKGSDHLFSAQLIDAKDSKLSGKGSYVRTGVGTGDASRVALALAQQLKGPQRAARVNVTPQQQWFEPEMVFVEGGTYQMGYNSSVDGTKSNYMMSPHSVTVNSFYIGKYQVTRAQWIAVMSGATGRTGITVTASPTYTQDISDPSKWKDDDQLPMENVSWEDVTGKNGTVSAATDIPAEGYLERLNALTGKNYRLPTEEEWEYAARGGKHQSPYKYSGSNNLNDVAWTSENAGSRTHVVGGRLPNALGIYDMSGNVVEWCSDCWRVDYNSAEDCSLRIRRGGSWYPDGMGYYLVAARNYITPLHRSGNFGFRVVLPAQ
jgi:formylglycine-generating enzyme required for sulfatase activity